MIYLQYVRSGGAVFLVCMFDKVRDSCCARWRPTGQAAKFCTFLVHAVCAESDSGGLKYLFDLKHNGLLFDSFAVLPFNIFPYLCPLWATLHTAIA